MYNMILLCEKILGITLVKRPFSVMLNCDMILVEAMLKQVLLSSQL